MAAGKTTMPVAILPERDMKSLRLKTMLLSVLGIHYGSTKSPAANTPGTLVAKLPCSAC